MNVPDQPVMPELPPIEVPVFRPRSELPDAEKQAAFSRIESLLKDKNAVLVAHYYTDPAIQELAERTGGIVADSLAMAQFGAQHPAKTLVVSGVRFMGETAKIISPEKRVLVPDMKAECSLDLACPADLFKDFCQQHPERTVVVYANTSAEVKALSDWVVTSRIGLDVIAHLHEKGEKILWAPDRYLGDYIQQQTGADMLIWQGSCVVHEEFKAQALKDLMQQHPDAAVLVHPESPRSVIALADVVGSTGQLIKAVQTRDNASFIVATDQGIFYKMQQLAPEKDLMLAPTGGVGATCKSCGHCPWMALSSLAKLEQVLTTGENEILLDAATIAQAQIPLQRMLEFQC